MISYHYFDHDADMGIEGRGQTLEEAFIGAAQAVFAMMSDLSKIPAQDCVEIEFAEEDPEFALVTWLNQLIAKAQSENLILSQFELTQENSIWRGRGCGIKWSSKIERGVDVKGATLTMLSVKKENNYWTARCVVDL